MKYEIFVNGGFANIPKQYQGEIDLTDVEKNILIQAMRKKIMPLNEIHDGYIYHIKLNDGVHEYKCVFNEHTLPEHVLKFMDNVIKSS